MFNFSEKSTPVRVQVINGEPWFVAKDIAEALGYSNPRKAINDHCKEKGVTFRDSLTEGGVVCKREAQGCYAADAGVQKPVKCIENQSFRRNAAASRRLRPGDNGATGTKSPEN